MRPLFIHPDSEFNIQIIRILAILEKLSHNKNGNPILNIEKIAVFDFFLRHPSIFFDILKKSDKKIPFVLDETEKNSISANFPSTISLYRFEEYRKIIQILYIWGFMGIEVSEWKEPYYIITDSGSEFLKTVDTVYLQRQLELATACGTLVSQTYKNLVANIIPHINGK